MSRYFQDVAADAKLEGMKEGMKEGIKEGKLKGKLETVPAREILFKLASPCHERGLLTFKACTTCVTIPARGLLNQ